MHHVIEDALSDRTASTFRVEASASPRLVVCRISFCVLFFPLKKPVNGLHLREQVVWVGLPHGVRLLSGSALYACTFPLH
jgi:hypothetical protein